MLEPLILSFIIIGSVIMLGDIVFYLVFMVRLRDVISSGKRSDDIWKNIGFVLLLFFLAGYLIVGFVFNPDIITALIMLFGAVFVSIMLFLTHHLLETAKERSMEIAQVLVDVMDERDPNLNGHSHHVKEVTMTFYKYLPYNLKSKINQVSLEYASLMHDIGKLGVPEAILNKPDKLNKEEWDIMKTHPKKGVKILEPIKTFDSISDWIMYHHERVDGNGYYNMKPEEVPLAAKIIAIADTYSAITMRRSYKAPRSHEEAMEIIKDVAGTQLDKELVEIFLTIPKEELIKCSRQLNNHEK